ncbi:MAG: hypothetical protein M3R36_00540 [Bacteroidota bacterium]|nr:hypothetical protein [Bacteroidota bacterium]
MKIYKYNILKLSSFLKYTFKKLRIRSGLTLLLLFVHQSLFAQAAEIETSSFSYSDFLVVMLIILIATIFIGLEILGDPKYVTLNTVQNKSQVVANSFISPGYVFEKNVTTKFKIAVYSAGLLLVVYAVLLFLMF